MGKTDHATESGETYKRCPECFAKLPLNAKKCYECNQTVHEADRFGLAKKPVNWLGYAAAVFLWVGLGYYIWWAFF